MPLLCCRRALGVDTATIVGHKFGAPKGVAALYISRDIPPSLLGSYLMGGGQEGGRRAGTENVLLIAGLGRAAELALHERDALTEHMRRLRDSLQQQLQDTLPKVWMKEAEHSMVAEQSSPCPMA